MARYIRTDEMRSTAPNADAGVWSIKVVFNAEYLSADMSIETFAKIADSLPVQDR